MTYNMEETTRKSTKTCTKCLKEKDMEDFYNLKRSKDGKVSSCKVCSQSGRKKSQAKRDDYHRKVAAERHLIRKYGITMSERDALLESQGGTCAICKKEGDFVVDHCHSTEDVRGILCRTCNQGLGLFYDDVESLQNAIEYLEGSRE